MIKFIFHQKKKEKEKEKEKQIGFHLSWLKSQNQ